MKRMFSLASLLVGLSVSAIADTPVTSAEVENELQQIVAAPNVTIIHLWAPWCSNCRNEMRSDGWAKFVAENPSVKIVFLNIWHKGQDPAPKLAAAGLGAQNNFLSRNHPNASTEPGKKLDRLLGMPVAWVPTTWVYRAGKLRYALNYGEVRFEMLQQMVKDAAAPW